MTASGFIINREITTSTKKGRARAISSQRRHVLSFFLYSIKIYSFLLRVSLSMS